MKKILLLFVFAILALGQLCAQTKNVSGIVLDETETPLPGATVKITGTTDAVMTDPDGKFSLEVKSGQKKLTISFIGMESQTVDIAPWVTVVMLPDSRQLEEVVSVGYYQKKQGAMTGSVSVIKEEVFKQPVSNITQMLQGTSPGLIAMSNSGKPSQGADISIRGIGSINSNTAPLYVLDGIPIGSSDFAMMNPNDIESMNILKDATATALYGSRGANGVIVIQSKKGREGETIVKYRGEFGFSNVLRGNLELMNTQEKLAYEIKLGLIDPNTADGKKTIAERSKFDLDHFKDVFGTPLLHSHSVSVIGGGNKTKFSFMGGYSKQEGIISYSDYSKMNISANIDHQINKWVRLGNNFFIGQSNDNFPMTTEVDQDWSQDNPVNIAIRLNPYEPIKDENGNYRQTLGSYGSTYNPMKEAGLNEFEVKKYSLRNSTYLEIEPITDLKFRSSLGLSLSNSNTTFRISPLAQRGQSSNGALKKENALDYTIIQNNQISYSKKFNNHTATIIGGTEILKEKDESLGLTVTGVAHDYFTQVSQYERISPNGWSGGISEHSMASFYAILNYDFANKYFVDLSIRTDGDSRLSRGNQWRRFWSAGAQWNLKREDFMKDIDVISSARLRFNAGSTGNSNIGNYASIGTYRFTTYMGNTASMPANNGNDKITWEETFSYGLGTEVNLFNNRLRTIIDLYRRNTTNLFLNTPQTLTSGFSRMMRNTGEMYNQGIEVSVGGDIIRNNDFYIGLEGNISLNENQVTKLYEGIDEIVDDYLGIITKPGYPYRQVHAVRWAGVNVVNGDPMWYDKNGNMTSEYSANDAVALKGKSLLPNKTAGLGINASYKGISFHAMFTSLWDKWIINKTLHSIEIDNGLNGYSYNHTKRAIDFWTKPGDVTEFPRYNSKAQQYDTRILENQSFIRLKNVTLSYDLNKKLLAKQKVVRAARFYTTAQNLLTFTKYRGLDPEVTGATDLGRYPTARTFTFGIELTF